MEAIAALKSVVHFENNERRHPSDQGFVTPLLMGFMAYASVLTIGLACAAVLTSMG